MSAALVRCSHSRTCLRTGCMASRPQPYDAARHARTAVRCFDCKPYVDGGVLTYTVAADGAAAFRGATYHYYDGLGGEHRIGVMSAKGSNWIVGYFTPVGGRCRALKEVFGVASGHAGADALQAKLDAWAAKRRLTCAEGVAVAEACRCEDICPYCGAEHVDGSCVECEGMYCDECLDVDGNCPNCREATT
jgi:hypothetical protein